MSYLTGLTTTKLMSLSDLRAKMVSVLREALQEHNNKPLLMGLAPNVHATQHISYIAS